MLMMGGLGVGTGRGGDDDDEEVKTFLCLRVEEEMFFIFVLCPFRDNDELHSDFEHSGGVLFLTFSFLCLF